MLVNLDNLVVRLIAFEAVAKEINFAANESMKNWRTQIKHYIIYILCSSISSKAN